MKVTITAAVRDLIVERLNESSPQEIARIVGALAANDQIEAVAQTAALSTPKGLAASASATRFVNLDKSAKPTTGEHVAVYDRMTDLVWSRGIIGRELNHADAMKAAAAFELFGKTWRAPTLPERFSITNYARHTPALDTAHFEKDSGWEWTSTIDAESPSGCAWGVSLGGGYCLRGLQGDRNGVRAVLAGQQLNLSL